MSLERHEERRNGLASVDVVPGLHCLEVVSSARQEEEAVTPPTDSLATELAAVPAMRIASCISGCHTIDGGPDGPALAVAARKWMRQQLPNRLLAEFARESDHVQGFNDAIASVALMLGLEDTP